MIGFCYNSKRVELYDPSQARDDSGKWTGSGGGASIPSEPQAKHDEASKTPVVYHGTSAEVLKNIREKGLRASRSGVWGKGVYATSSMETALEYGALKSTSSARIMGKSLIGLIEVASSGFKKVSEYNADSKRHGRKASGVIEILLSDSDVPSSMIKSMKIFDAKAVRNWIFEGGEQPKPLATKNLQEGSIFVPIIIDENEADLEVDYTGTPKDSCPIATQDIKTNLKNRAHAVEDASYGPANPKEPNEEFWTKMAKNFNTTPDEAKTMRCGNCAAFNKTSRMLACIKKGIGADAEEVAKAGDLGFCEFFDFKCASLRTCSAWVVGGPITDKEEKSVEFFDPSQERDESGRWTSGGGSSKQGKLIEKIKKQNPNADVASEAVKTGVNNIVKAVRGAKIVAKYGGTKTSEIVKWLRSDDGDKFLKAVGDGLRVVGGGAIGAVRGVHNARFKILAGALINPALAPYFASASATKGFFDGALKEYRGQGHGRDISNAIREKIGVKPMQAYVQSIKLQAKKPPLEDVVAYLTDVLRISIDEAIDGKERFEVVSFFDPSQERDESGKWTSEGGSAQSQQPLTPKEGKYAEEFKQYITPQHLPSEEVKKEYNKDVEQWSRRLSGSEYDVSVKEAKKLCDAVHNYCGMGFRNVNDALRGKVQPSDSTKKLISTLHLALAVAPKISDNAPIWRGAKGSTKEDESVISKIAKTVKVGSIIKDSGFSSFSKSKDIAVKYSLWDANDKSSSILIKLKKAKGVGVKVPLFLTPFSSEKEVLLPPRTRLKVLAVNKKEKDIGSRKIYQTSIEAEVIK